MTHTHLIIVSFFLLAQNSTFAQNDSIKTIEITANSTKTDIINNENDNFYNNIRLQTNIALKQYGVNNIANLRLRGAVQTTA